MLAPTCLLLFFVLFIVRNEGLTCFLHTLLTGSDWGADLQKGDDNSSKNYKKVWNIQEFPSHKAGPYVAPIPSYPWCFAVSHTSQGFSRAVWSLQILGTCRRIIHRHWAGMSLIFKLRCTENTTDTQPWSWLRGVTGNGFDLGVLKLWPASALTSYLCMIFNWFICPLVTLANFQAKVKAILFLIMCSLRSLPSTQSHWKEELKYPFLKVHKIT